jgi:hypothetical protein
LTPAARAISLGEGWAQGSAARPTGGAMAKPAAMSTQQIKVKRFIILSSS